MGSEVKKDPVSVGIDALAIGGGTAAIVAMIRQVAEANRQKKAKEKLLKNEISPDTVVLRIPGKGLAKASEDQCGECNKPSAVVRPGLETREIRPFSTVGPRDLRGRFSTLNEPKEVDSEKSAGYIDGVRNDTAAILAGIGGVAGGYYLVSKLSQKLEQKRLQRQIEAAQTEYIDLLDNRNTKIAEAFSTVFQINDGIVEEVSGDMEKAAGIPTDIANVINGGFDAARKGSAVALASYILTAGGTAYVVKKYLESKYGKRDEEEKPTPQTRILIKPGSADETFEVSPAQMLATVCVFRDCIEDSVEPGSKQAADYSFLDKIDKMEGGPQFLLDSYAKMNGLSRPESNFKLPVSMMLGYGGTLADIKKNPEKHKPQIQGYVMQMMRRDPKKWFDLLGQDRNSDIVGMKADEQLANMRNSGGVMGFLHRIPVIGDLIRKLSSWFTKSTSMGRRGAAGKTLEMMGLSGDRANKVMGMYDFTSSGWTPKQTQSVAGKRPVSLPRRDGGLTARTKTAGYGYGDIMAIMARDKTLTDSTNKEILKAIEELKKPKRKKGVDEPKVKVEFDDKLNELLSEEDKARIIANLTK